MVGGYQWIGSYNFGGGATLDALSLERIKRIYEAAINGKTVKPLTATIIFPQPIRVETAVTVKSYDVADGTIVFDIETKPGDFNILRLTVNSNNGSYTFATG